MHEGRTQTDRWPAHAGSRLKLGNGSGRRRLKCQPSSRTGENPLSGMSGGIEETSASFEARTAPRSYPTLAAMIIDRLGTTTFEGTTDQSWFQAAVDRRADTAAVNAIASGSQHSTMRAISNRIARSSSPPMPINSVA
jgi:hypothetical protein